MVSLVESSSFLCSHLDSLVSRSPLCLLSVELCVVSACLLNWFAEALPVVPQVHFLSILFGFNLICVFPHCKESDKHRGIFLSLGGNLEVGCVLSVLEALVQFPGSWPALPTEMTMS